MRAGAGTDPPSVAINGASTVVKTKVQTKDKAKVETAPDPAYLAESEALPIVETFHSIQGEGFWTGTNAFFIRLAGCDVGCPWCDTKQSWSARHHPQRLLTGLVAEAVAAQPKIVIVTGGEPLMHNLDPLTQALHAAGLTIHLETSGSHPWSGEW
ncbi:MAG: 7-carboxy-7-deazaguanine synthase QueE [Synechococcaceae cyanobacterium RM1_1_27]|nr:7-carboxy-7-deazaguanine synthase QueE [Synechococcaceae cyanobacterium RM1_1_27]